MRLRYQLYRDTALIGRVLRVWLRAVEARFGASINAHTHPHLCALDGVFSQDRDGTLRFHRASVLSDSDIAAVEATTRTRALRVLEREGLGASSLSGLAGNFSGTTGSEQ